MKMRFRMFVIIPALVIAAILACAAISAQQSTPPATAENAGKKPPEEVSGTAKYMKRAWSGKKITLLRGDVKFTHGDTTLASDEIEFNEDSKTAVSPGKVMITGPECDITGDKGSAYFKKKLTILEGNIVLNLRPKKTEEDAKADKDSIRAKAKESPSIINCDKLEYQYKTKIATAMGNVKLKQNKRSASADKAIYDEKKELLTLIGNVKGTDENGQTFAAPKVVISNKKGDEWLEAPNATATFKVDLDEDQEQKPEQQQ